MNKNKTINVSLDRAREWYNGSDESLRNFALECYSSDELEVIPFEKIKTFKDAVNALNMDLDFVKSVVAEIEKLSNASAAMYKLNIVRKALNLGEDLYFTEESEDSEIYCPYNPFVTENSTFFEKQINSGEMEIIGKIKVQGILYNVLCGYADYGSYYGLGCFYPPAGVGYAESSSSIFGCANEEIAEHFSKYFGMLITEAKFGDLPDFEIIEEKYRIN